jgi:hypothetical protein
MPRFDSRAFVASAAVISGIGLPVTGLGIHLSQAHPVTPSYHAWMTTHWSLGILFAVFTVWHVVLNRRALLRHLRGARPRIREVSREAALAITLVAVVLFAAVAHPYAL